MLADMRRMGETIANLRVVQTIWHDALKRIVEAYETRRELSISERVEIRLIAAKVTKLCSEIVRDITASSGGSCYFETSPLQRMQRDVEVLKSHASLDWDRGCQMSGKVALGLPLAPTDLF